MNSSNTKQLQRGLKLQGPRKISDKDTSFETESSKIVQTRKFEQVHLVADENDQQRSFMCPNITNNDSFNEQSINDVKLCNGSQLRREPQKPAVAEYNEKSQKSSKLQQQSCSSAADYNLQQLLAEDTIKCDKNQPQGSRKILGNNILKRQQSKVVNNKLIKITMNNENSNNIIFLNESNNNIKLVDFKHNIPTKNIRNNKKLKKNVIIGNELNELQLIKE